MSQMQNRIVTSCRECKWSLWQDNQQTGCGFGLLEKYKDAGINVIEAEDGEREFNVIDRICLYSRNHESQTTQEEVIESIKVRYQVIHIISENLDEYAQFIESIKVQEIPPKHVTVIRPPELDVQPFKYTKLLKQLSMPWRYQDATNRELTVNDLIDIALDAIEYPYYITTYAPLPEDLSRELNYLVNEKFIPFSYLCFGDIDIVPTIHHKQLGGNSFKPLYSKIISDDYLKDYVNNGIEFLPCLINSK